MSQFSALKEYVWSPENGLTSEFDRQFAAMLVRRAGVVGEQGEALAILAAVAHHAVLEGHSCLKIAEWAQQVRQAEPRHTVSKQLKVWESLMLQARLGCDEVVGPDGASKCPLIRVDNQNVYLNRMRRYEKKVARRLLDIDGPRESDISRRQIRDSYAYFACTSFQNDLQQVAVYQALRRRLAVVTGGPGTGKTTVLALILAWRHVENSQETIALCAPTGKAAQRMKDALRSAINDIQCPPMPETVVDFLHSQTSLTVHKLLGLHEASDNPHFHAGHPLPYDLVVVDECSMMSLQLFSQLLSALKPEAQLLLLGDKDQLTSVDAGNIMAELYAALSRRPVADGECPAVTRLVKNHRSRANQALCRYVSAMAELSAAEGAECLPAEELQTLGEESDGIWMGRCLLRELPRRDMARLEAELTEAMNLMPELAGDGELWQRWRLAAHTVDMAYRLTESFKVLCAVREGRYGVLTVNNLMRLMLKCDKPYATGMPVIITQNDPITGLNNGDTGVCFAGYVHFPTEDGRYRRYVPTELPSHECAFAMTVHKSQGSGYDNVFMLLPDRFNPVLTRELIYTGMTRTKRNLTILSPQDIFHQAIARPTLRWSGLQQELVKDE